MKMNTQKKFYNALISIDRLTAQRISEEYCRSNPAERLIEEVIVPAMDDIGSGWEKGNIALSQVYMSGRICEKIVNTIIPSATHTPKNHPKMAITVLEDYHMIGKRIVYTGLKSYGYNLIDYDRTSIKELISKVIEDKIDIILISTLMLSSALKVSEVRLGLPDNVKIIVGGAPFRFDQNLWVEVGADAMAKNASHAAEIIEDFEGVIS